MSDILQFGEDMPSCPTCGRRLMITDKPVRRDDDGDIHAGICIDHGTWLVQSCEEEEELD